MKMGDKEHIHNDSINIKFGSPKTYNDIYEAMFDGVYGIDETTQESLQNQCIFCLSMTSKSNIMWGHYADNHKGFCIAYFPIKLYGIALHRGWWNSAVSYSTHPYNSDTDFSIWDGFRPFKASEVPRQVSMQFRKDRDWAYEEEYRFIKSTVTTKEHVIEEIPKHYIACIIFGCAAPDNEIKDMMQRHPELDYFQARPEKSKYSIDSYHTYLSLEGDKIKRFEKEEADKKKEEILAEITFGTAFVRMSDNDMKKLGWGLDSKIKIEQFNREISLDKWSETRAHYHEHRNLL